MSGINVEEYLTADDDFVVFEVVTEEDNPFRLRFLSRIKDEMGNDDEEDDDTDTSQFSWTSLCRLQSGVAPVGRVGGQGPLSGMLAPPPVRKIFVPRSRNGVLN
ncbi:hypothetical protein AVEN_140414-1 [Araneus ventricosus]|uniref:Uncharacterized protein n=1 Tax=Araneus ventricosus TaxID=182803 RepID=A0A4Y2P4N9_ARAVE|nr:hypothetical protein AVEN_140414-1 [Araneus ventricosus]